MMWQNQNSNACCNTNIYLLRFDANVVVGYMLVLLYKVEKDGTFKVIDGSNRAGRSFCGIGRLLTGSKVCLYGS